jgi:glycosyltransferase involved in cell wall biosynthesis
MGYLHNVDYKRDMTAARPPLSAVLITLNAASQLKGCLDSLGFCDEVLVVDSGSSDGTAELAQRWGARVMHADWRGFGEQKQFAVLHAEHDWVLCLDADERVTTQLQQAILKEFAAPRFHAYRFRRCNRFLGRWLRHGEGYPDWSLRLFDRRHARWSQDVIHEKVIGAVDALPLEVGSLEGDLLHESAETLDAYLAKQNRYTTLAARDAFASGRKASPFRLLISPVIRFIKFYFLRLGFLDGLPGLVHILIGCGNSFLKYAKIMDEDKR